MTRSERLAEVHRRAMERFDAIWANAQQERQRCLSDRRFATIPGAMWEGQYAYGDPDAQDAGIPRMEIPKVHKSLIRIFSEYRNNRVTVDFRPRGNASDTGSADNLDGLYRADENDTRGGGQAAYDNAFDEGIGGGFGAWRLRAEYESEEDEENEKQRIRIEPIYDADQSVFFDLDAKHQDKSDAGHAFLLSTISRAAFEARYPDRAASTFAAKLTWDYDWVTADNVTLAEYYDVDEGRVLRRTFRNIVTGDEQTEDDARLTNDPEDDGRTLEAELLATGWEEVRRRWIKRPKVRKYLLSGAECLSDEGVIAGPNIPIVPFYGKRWYIDGVERCMGHTRLSIDSSRVYNMVISSMVEAAAASPIARPVFDPEQVQGLETSWARANIDRAPYSLARVLYDGEGKPIQVGPTTIITPPQLAPNVAALIQVAGQDIAELSGEAEQQDDVPANTSAQAIELVQTRSDMRTFIYQDNLRKAMQRSGEIWLGMARELYVEEGREMVAIDAEGQQSVIKLAEPATDPEAGNYLKNDLTRGKYEVIVDVGPASRTRKDATVKAMVGIAQTAAAIGMNDTAAAALSVAIVNMDGEGIDGLRAMERKKGVAGGWIEPNEQERAELEAEAQNRQPDPQTQLVLAAAQQAQAEAAKAQAQTVESQAKAEKARADAVATLAEVDREDRQQVLDAVRDATEAQGGDTA